MKKISYGFYAIVQFGSIWLWAVKSTVLMMSFGADVKNTSSLKV